MSASLFRSLASSWIGLALAIVIGLCIAPFVVHTLGADVYGLWAFVISFTSQFVIFDLGAREAIVSFVAQFRHAGDDEALCETASSGALFFFLAGAAAFVLMLCALPFLGELAAIPPNHLATVRLIFIIAALDTAIEIALGLFDAILAGSERYDVMTGLNITRLIVNAVTLWIVLTLGFGLIGLALTTLILRLGQRVATWALCHRYNPNLLITPQRVTRRTLKRIGSFSAGASVIHVSHRLIHRVDTLVAGFFLGPVAVTSYAIPVILIDQFRMFAESGNGILTPRFSRLHAAQDPETTKLLLLRWSRFSFLLALAIGSPLIVTGGDFLRLWMGPAFPESTNILVLLTLPYYLTLPSMVFTYYLYATNRHALNARIMALEATLNLIFSLVLVRTYGLSGIALGTLIPAVFCRGVLVPVRATQLGVATLSEYVRASFTSCLPLAAAHLGLLLCLRFWIGAESWLTFTTCNIVAFAGLLGATWIFYLGPLEKGYLMRRLGLSVSNAKGTGSQ